MSFSGPTIDVANVNMQRTAGWEAVEEERDEGSSGRSTWKVRIAPRRSRNSVNVEYVVWVRVEFVFDSARSNTQRALDAL